MGHQCSWLSGSGSDPRNNGYFQGVGSRNQGGSISLSVMQLEMNSHGEKLLVPGGFAGDTGTQMGFSNKIQA